MSRGFRVWDVEAEEYLPNSNGTSDGVLGISADGKNVIWLEDGEATFFEDGRSVIIERSTGLKDKNGKRICEGDIVKWTNGLNEIMFYEVYFNECRATFLLNPIDGGMTEGMSDKKKPYIEVIGNMNENPEWLGGEE